MKVVYLLEKSLWVNPNCTGRTTASRPPTEQLSPRSGVGLRQSLTAKHVPKPRSSVVLRQDICSQLPKSLYLPQRPHHSSRSPRKGVSKMTAMLVLGVATHADTTSQSWPAKGGPAMCPTKESAVGPWRRGCVGLSGLGKVSATGQSTRQLEQA
jgi:hypothetical protein